MSSSTLQYWPVTKGVLEVGSPCLLGSFHALKLCTSANTGRSKKYFIAAWYCCQVGAVPQTGSSSSFGVSPFGSAGSVGSSHGTPAGHMSNEIIGSPPSAFTSVI